MVVAREHLLFVQLKQILARGKQASQGLYARSENIKFPRENIRPIDPRNEINLSVSELEKKYKIEREREKKKQFCGHVLRQNTEPIVYLRWVDKHVIDFDQSESENISGWNVTAKLQVSGTVDAVGRVSSRGKENTGSTYGKVELICKTLYSKTDL